ncbi:MAG: hotdog fold thioesterase [Betaproteobacteria bacterium]|nr:hotdog fold thioesterase [Betaproteobacteria bacterium]
MNDTIWFFRPPLEQLNQTADTMLSRLGIEFTEIGNDYVTARMPVDHRTHQPYGLLHGGASVTLAETLGSTGAYLCVDPERFLVVGLEINANHVRGVREGWVTGTARPLHRGKTTQLWEIKIIDDAGKLVCVSRITMAILEKKPAA